MIATAVVLLLPGATLHQGPFAAYLNSDWTHFLAFAAASAIALLVWKLRFAVAACAGVAAGSVGLQMVRGVLTHRGLDLDGSVINLLGMAAGILCALHIRRSGWLVKYLQASETPRTTRRGPETAAPNVALRSSAQGHQPIGPYHQAAYGDQLTLRAVDSTVNK